MKPRPRFKCPRCGRLRSAPEARQGVVGYCPHCRLLVTPKSSTRLRDCFLSLLAPSPNRAKKPNPNVPEPKKVVLERFAKCRCDNCGQKLEFEAHRIGTKIECPSCRVRVRLYDTILNANISNTQKPSAEVGANPSKPDSAKKAEINMLYSQGFQEWLANENNAKKTKIKNFAKDSVIKSFTVFKQVLVILIILMLVGFTGNSIYETVQKRMELAEMERSYHQQAYYTLKKIEMLNDFEKATTGTSDDSQYNKAQRSYEQTSRMLDRTSSKGSIQWTPILWGVGVGIVVVLLAIKLSSHKK